MKYYSIGEMAKLSFVSIQTLRYYDKINLLKPNYIDSNRGYRYYTHSEFQMLDTIHYLKSLGMSLGEIKEYYENRTVENSLNTFEKRLVNTRKSNSNMRSVEKRLKYNIQNLRNSSKFVAGKEPAIVTLPDRHMASVNQIIFSDAEYEILIRSLSHHLYDNHFGEMGDLFSIKAKEDIIRGEYEKTIKIGIIVRKKMPRYSTELLAGGDYACIYHIGDYKRINESYKKLCLFISQNHYKLNGDAIEEFIIDAVETKNSSEYIARVQIPIKKNRLI